MVVGERFVKDGKTYEVSEVWGNNYGFHEVKDEVKEVPVFEAPVEEVKEEIPVEEVKKPKRGRKKA